MSHVAQVDLHVTDLEALEKACEKLGLEFRRNQTTYKWFGRHVGDYPLPAGFKATDLGRCEHAIGIKGNRSAYEVGIVKRRDGKPGYTLMWDFWAGGYGLQAVVGNDCNNLKQRYGVEVARKAARKQGFTLTEKTMQDGTIRLTARR